MANVNRQHKDRLFRMIFSEPEHALELYNALRGTDHDDPGELSVVTLEDAIWLTMKNDVAVLVRDELLLFEHQSTPNPNMPLRGLLYFAREYEGLVASSGGDIFGSAKIGLAAPSYYVFYNGTDERPDDYEMRLSDAFSKPSPGYEWTARVRNVNAGRSPDLLGASEWLRGYAEIVGAIRRRAAEGMPLDDAVGSAVDECIERGIMAEYLKKHRAEVFSVLLTEYDEELHRKNEADYWLEKGREEGLEKGREEGRERLVAKLREQGVDESAIAAALAAAEAERAET